MKDTNRKANGAEHIPDEGGNAQKGEPCEFVPAEFRARFEELVALTDAFCQKRLNAEYALVIREMVGAACEECPEIQKAQAATWAAACVHAAGWVNFLHDPESGPCTASTAEIAAAFGVSVSNMMAKSRILREALELHPFDPDFTIPSLQDKNPLTWMIQLSNGMIADIRMAPREVQEQALKAGLIPYIPADREETEAPKMDPVPVKAARLKAPKSPADEGPTLFDLGQDG
jgi:hypothetical protein